MADENPFDPIATTDEHFAQTSAERGLGPGPLDYVGRDVLVGPGQTQTVPELRGGWADFARNQDMGGGRSNADMLIDNAINARRGLELSRQQTINQLSATGSRNRSQQLALGAQLHGIESQIRGNEWEAAARLHGADAAQRESDRRMTIDRRTAIDEHGAEAMDRMIEADNLFRGGQISKEEHDQVYLNLPNQFPEMLENPSASRHFNYAVNRSDRMSDIQSRMDMREAAILSRKYRVPMEVDPQTGEPSLEMTRQSALQSPLGKSEQLHTLNQELFQRYGLSTGVSSLFNPLSPHQGGTVDESGKFVATDPSKGAQTHIGIPFVDPKTQAVNHVPVPISTFNQMKADFEPEYRGIVGEPSASPAPSQSFQAGQRYRDASGNMATYNQDGTWTPVTQ